MHSKLKVGDLLYRSKGIVQHAGVYLGNGQVLHNQPEKGVNITSYSDYAQGENIKVIRTEATDVDLISKRLEEIISSDQDYSLLTNNCEHVAHYLINGRTKSSQLQAVIVGAFISAFIAYRYQKGNILLWASAGGVFTLLITQLFQQYDSSLHLDNSLTPTT